MRGRLETLWANSDRLEMLASKEPVARRQAARSRSCWWCGAAGVVLLVVWSWWCGVVGLVVLVAGVTFEHKNLIFVCIGVDKSIFEGDVKCIFD